LYLDAGLGKSGIRLITCQSNQAPYFIAIFIWKQHLCVELRDTTPSEFLTGFVKKNMSFEKIYNWHFKNFIISAFGSILYECSARDMGTLAHDKLWAR